MNIGGIELKPWTEEEMKGLRERQEAFAKEHRRRGGVIPPPASRAAVAATNKRLAALEAEVAALRAELADLRRQTLGFRWANSSNSEDRAAPYQAGVE